MTTFKGKVAVVTGAASGIGRAIAERCVEEGMRVVLADIEHDALRKMERNLKKNGSSVLSVRTDVSKLADVEKLAEGTIRNFKEVHILFNNAGVGAGTSVWESSIADWEWVLGVNLWGVIHGIRTFVPIMLKQKSECHVVNTASIAGLISGPWLGIYKVAKHGIVSLSETLYHELRARGSEIGVSVLCPGWVRTKILSSERNRPKHLQNRSTSAKLSAEDAETMQMIQQAVENGLSPTDVAQDVFSAIKHDKFYIITPPEGRSLVRLRMKDILKGRKPTQPSRLMMLIGSTIAKLKNRKSA